MGNQTSVNKTPSGTFTWEGECMPTDSGIAVPHGKGKLLCPDGTKYKGQWENGWLKFTEEQKDGSEYTNMYGDRYKGPVKDGMPYGEGEMLYSSKEKYKGAFKRGRKHGQGVLTYEDGRRYDGAFVKNEITGSGKMYNAAGGREYAGMWKDGKMHGEGVQSLRDGSSYDGEFVSGKRNGRGEMTYPDGRKFKGTFKDDEPNGQGTLTLPDDVPLQSAWTGEWKLGFLWVGSDQLMALNGDYYLGGLQNGVPTGQGTLRVFSTGNTTTGNFALGSPSGLGVRNFRDGSKYEGDFEEGDMHGWGKMFKPTGALEYEGNWVRNKPKKK